MNINLSTIDFCPSSGGEGARLQDNKAASITSNGTVEVTPDATYDGMKKVTATVNVQPTLETKTTEMLLSETSITVTADQGYDGLSSVTVTHAPVEENTTETITTNGEHIIIPGDGYDATMQVTATVNVPMKPEETLTQTITANGSQTFNPTSGSVFDKAVITVAVPGPSGIKFINDNGDYDITDYASAVVSVSVEPIVPIDELWYTTPDGTVQNFTDLSALGVSYGGPAIVSNTYGAGKGVIKFAEPLTWIGFNVVGGSLVNGPLWLCAPQAGLPINKLESVVLPRSVTYIGGLNHQTFGYIGAFSNCQFLREVTFGGDVTTIEAGTFTYSAEYAPEYLNIYSNAVTPPTLGRQSEVFTTAATIYVPNSSLSAYRSAWATYGPSAANKYKADDRLYVQDKAVTPSSSAQYVTADEPYVALNSVTVSAAPSPTLQSKTATPTNSSQVVSPDSGYAGLSSVTVNGYDVDTLYSTITSL